MRKIILFFALLVATLATATPKDSLNAVTMIGYEQRGTDSEGTLSLKNNTDTHIHDLSFRITYLDMNGNELDYRDFDIEEEIAPGMTKKIDIPGYEWERNYSYYKSEAFPYNPHRFKIKFALQDYNGKDKAQDASLTDTTSVDFDLHKADDPSPFLIIPGVFIFLSLILGIYVGCYVLVAVMAQRRHRNAALWVLVSLFATPLLAIIILLCIGKSPEYYDDRG